MNRKQTNYIVEEIIYRVKREYLTEGVGPGKILSALKTIVGFCKGTGPFGKLKNIINLCQGDAASVAGWILDSKTQAMNLTKVQKVVKGVTKDMIKIGYHYYDGQYEEDFKAAKDAADTAFNLIESILVSYGKWYGAVIAAAFSAIKSIVGKALSEETNPVKYVYAILSDLLKLAIGLGLDALGIDARQLEAFDNAVHNVNDYKRKYGNDATITVNGQQMSPENYFAWMEKERQKKEDEANKRQAEYEEEMRHVEARMRTTMEITKYDTWNEFYEWVKTKYPNYTGDLDTMKKVNDKQLFTKDARGLYYYQDAAENVYYLYFGQNGYRNERFGVLQNNYRNQVLGGPDWNPMISIGQLTPQAQLNQMENGSKIAFENARRSGYSYLRQIYYNIAKIKEYNAFDKYIETKHPQHGDSARGFLNDLVYFGSNNAIRINDDGNMPKRNDRSSSWTIVNKDFTLDKFLPYAKEESANFLNNIYAYVSPRQINNAQMQKTTFANDATRIAQQPRAIMPPS